MSSLSCLYVWHTSFSSLCWQKIIYTFYIDSNFNFMLKSFEFDAYEPAQSIEYIICIWIYINININRSSGNSTRHRSTTNTSHIQNDWLKINYKTYLDWMAANGVNILHEQDRKISHSLCADCINNVLCVRCERMGAYEIIIIWMRSIEIEWKR